jgi:FkbM family methyltransferase
MQLKFANMPSHVVRGLSRRCRELRNTIEWSAAFTFHGEAPWSRNRWGQRYQAISLSEYHYLRDGNPETHESALLERILEPGMTVVDVGANHGMFSLEAAHLIGREGMVHAFEPAPGTLAVLRRNLAQNDLANVRVFPCGLGVREGTAPLRVHHEYSGLNTLAAREVTWNRRTLHADEIIDVPITTLDLHCAREQLDRIDLLKIDVEGFELDVLRGARGLLEERRIARILLEVGDLTCATAGVAPIEVLAFLQSHGYHLHAISPQGEVSGRITVFPESSFSANYFAIPAGGRTHSGLRCRGGGIE